MNKPKNQKINNLKLNVQPLKFEDVVKTLLETKPKSKGDVAPLVNKQS